MNGLHLNIFLIIIWSVACLQIPPIWITNTYTQSQSKDIITTDVNGSITNALVNYPFLTAFSTQPQITYGIFNYQAFDYMELEFFFIHCINYTTSSITFSAQVIEMTNIILLTIRYIAIDGAFPHKLTSFDGITPNYLNGGPTNITSQSSNINYYNNIVNYTNLANSKGYSYNTFSLPLLNNKIVLFINSMSLAVPLDNQSSPNPLIFKITTNIISNQLFILNLTLSTMAKLYNLQISLLCFDYADVLSSNLYQLTYQTIIFPSIGGFITIPIQFVPHLMIGLIGFSSDRTSAYINFNLQFVDANQIYGIQMIQTTSSTASQEYQYSLIYLKSWICSNNTYFNITSNMCESCSVYNCTQCQFLTVCFICNPGFYLNTATGQCMIITSLCGDSNFTLEQECEDGNIQNGDGCSSQCRIQSGYMCQTNPIKGIYTSICYYFDSITVQALYIEKDDYSNQIQIVFKLILKDHSILQGINLNSCLSISDPSIFQSYYVKENTDGTYSIIATYFKDISNLQIFINIDLTISGKRSLQRLPIIFHKMTIIPNDNQNAMFYEEYVYEIAQITCNLSYIICSLSIFMFILSLFGNKLVGLEMISVVQISYLSLLSLTAMNPCFKALTKLKFINGISYFYQSDDYMQDPYTPNQVKGIYLYPQFCKNYNYMLLLILTPYLSSLICLILSRSLIKSKKAQLQDLSKRLVCQYAFLGLMYSGYTLAVFFGLEINYGLRDLSQMIGIISTTQFVLMLLLLIIYFVLLLKKNQYFGQFLNAFVIVNFYKIQKMRKNQNQKLEPKFMNLFSRVWYNALMIQRLSVGCCLVFMYKILVSSILPICIFLSLTILVIFKKPYNKFFHNIRFIANMIICIAIQAIYLLFKIKSGQSYKQPIWYYLPIVICILLLICIAFNSVIIIKEVRENYLLCKNKKHQFNEQEDYLMIQMSNREIIRNNQRQFRAKDGIKNIDIKERKRVQKQLRRQLRLKNKICAKYIQNIKIIEQQSKQYSDV